MIPLEIGDTIDPRTTALSGEMKDVLDAKRVNFISNLSRSLRSNVDLARVQKAHPSGVVGNIPVSVEIVEPIFLRQAIHPMFLGDFLARQPLAEARPHRFQLRHRRASNGGVAGTVLHDEFFERKLKVR